MNMIFSFDSFYFYHKKDCKKKHKNLNILDNMNILIDFLLNNFQFETEIQLIHNLSLYYYFSIC